MTDIFMILTPIGAIFALLFAGWLANGILKKDPGNEKVVKITKAIMECANAYLKKQYAGVAMFFVIVN